MDALINNHGVVMIIKKELFQQIKIGKKIMKNLVTFCIIMMFDKLFKFRNIKFIKNFEF